LTTFFHETVAMTTKSLLVSRAADSMSAALLLFAEKGHIPAALVREAEGGKFALPQSLPCVKGGGTAKP
jgi:hypothetical protein